MDAGFLAPQGRQGGVREGCWVTRAGPPRQRNWRLCGSVAPARGFRGSKENAGPRFRRPGKNIIQRRFDHEQAERWQHKHDQQYPQAGGVPARRGSGPLQLGCSLSVLGHQDGGKGQPLFLNSETLPKPVPAHGRAGRDLSSAPDACGAVLRIRTCSQRALQ